MALAFAAFAVAARPAAGFFYGHVDRSAGQPKPSVITGPTGAELVAEAGLPRDWDWRSVGGWNMVTADVNQHIPNYCGSCWVHGAVASLNDRLKIMRGGAFPDVMISRQALMNCVPSDDGGPPPGCDGGSVHSLFSYMHETRVPDESCSPYLARNEVCEPSTVCRNCMPADAMAEMNTTEQCFATGNWTGYGVGDFGKVSGSSAMMREIYARGPITCGVVAGLPLAAGIAENAVQHEGVYVLDTPTNLSQIDHDVEVAGWGETPSGIEYWVIRNSWGTYWGDNGWFMLRRGVNQMQIEADCSWAVPTFDELSESLRGRDVLGNYFSGPRRVSDVPMPAVGEPFHSDIHVGVRLPAAPSPDKPAATSSTAYAAAIAAAFIAGIAVALVGTDLASRRSVVEPHEMLLG